MWTDAARAFAARLGLERALVQAPMAGVQGSALALAVSNAGGLGSQPAALLSADQLADELRAIAAGTTRPWSVNFFCHLPPAPDEAAQQRWRAALQPVADALGVALPTAPVQPARHPFDRAAAELLEAFRPPVVSFHFGLPEPALVAHVKRWGAYVLSSATTRAEGIWLQDHGADAVIAQGLEAGGHRGHFLSDDLTAQLGTFALVPQLVRALEVPVIAAGGVADAASVRAALALGAAGVQAGTAFLLSPEALTAPLHRAALDAPGAEHTALTNLFTGRPARGIVNRLMRTLGPLHADAPAFPLAGAALAPLRAAAEALGRTDCTPLWAGQNASSCRAVPAADVVHALWPEPRTT